MQSVITTEKDVDIINSQGTLQEAESWGQTQANNSKASGLPHHTVPALCGEILGNTFSMADVGRALKLSLRKHTG